MSTPWEGLAYVVRQGARVAWFMGHYLATEEFRPSGDRPVRTSGRSSAASAMTADLFALFREDFRNVERGYYPVPRDHDGSLPALLRQSRKFFSDIPQSARRRSEQAGREVYNEALARDYPAYYLQNFHYQSGGYLTADSASLYDMQVEVLFSGSANAMRRQCLVPIAQEVRAKDQPRLSLLDVACGTGRFLRFAKEAFPLLSVTGIDLSLPYLREAERHVAPFRVDFQEANAESLPFPSAAFDIVSSIYLFHEVPSEVRRRIAGEFARVLKPGGKLIFMDSLQLGDVQRYDPLLERFPLNFHEPYFASYLREDLNGLFTAAGLDVLSATPHFLSKRVVAKRL